MPTAPQGAPPWPGPNGPFGAVISYMTGLAYEARRAFNADRVHRGLAPVNIYDENNAAWINIPVNFALVIVDGVGNRHAIVDRNGIHGFGQHEDQGWWVAYCGEAKAYYNEAAIAANAGAPLPPPPVVIEPVPPPPIPPTLPPGTPPPDSNPSPFPQCPPGFYLNLAARPPRCEPLPSTTTPPAPVEGETAVLLLNGRYRVTAEFSAPGADEPGEARMIPLTTDSAAMWFFSPNNIELVAVVIPTERPGQPAVKLMGATNVGFKVKVEDTQGAHEPWTYENPVGQMFGIVDWGAFA